MRKTRRPSLTADNPSAGELLLPLTSVFTFFLSCAKRAGLLDMGEIPGPSIAFISLLTTLMTCFRFLKKEVEMRCVWILDYCLFGHDSRRFKKSPFGMIGEGWAERVDRSNANTNVAMRSCQWVKSAPALAQRLCHRACGGFWRRWTFLTYRQLTQPSR